MEITEKNGGGAPAAGDIEMGATGGGGAPASRGGVESRFMLLPFPLKEKIAEFLNGQLGLLSTELEKM